MACIDQKCEELTIKSVFENVIIFILVILERVVIQEKNTITVQI